MKKKEKILTGTIDGVPSSYNINYILSIEKRCFMCKKKFSVDDIEKNEIVCIDELDFCHKNCIDKSNVFYNHLRKNDKESPAKIKFI